MLPYGAGIGRHGAIVEHAPLGAAVVPPGQRKRPSGFVRGPLSRHALLGLRRERRDSAISRLDHERCTEVGLGAGLHWRGREIALHVVDELIRRERVLDRLVECLDGFPLRIERLSGQLLRSLKRRVCEIRPVPLEIRPAVRSSRSAVGPCRGRRSLLRNRRRGRERQGSDSRDTSGGDPARERSCSHFDPHAVTSQPVPSRSDRRSDRLRTLRT